jgi:acylglycerol lipase
MTTDATTYKIDHVTNNLQSGVVLHTWRVKHPRCIVILQHGYGEHAERYVDGHCELIQHLNKRGFEIRALDLWGHGHSPGIRGATDVAKAIRDHLELRRDAKREGLPLFLLGNSLGALVTAGSVVADPSMVDGVVLMSPPFPGQVSSLVRSVLATAATILPNTSLPTSRSPPSALSRQPDMLLPTETDPLMVKRQIPFLLATTALDTGQAIEKGLKDWHVPTLIMHGTADKAANPAGSKHFIEVIGSSDKTLRLFDSGLHELLNDIDREEALQEILTWFDSHIE